MDSEGSQPSLHDVLFPVFTVDTVCVSVVHGQTWRGEKFMINVDVPDPLALLHFISVQVFDVHLWSAHIAATSVNHLYHSMPYSALNLSASWRFITSPSPSFQKLGFPPRTDSYVAVPIIRKDFIGTIGLQGSDIRTESSYTSILFIIHQPDSAQFFYENFNSVLLLSQENLL